MGRKPLPKSEVRRVISVSLKPATITALDTMRGDTARSRWVEEMIEHLLPISEVMNAQPRYEIYCFKCEMGWHCNEKLESQRIGLTDGYNCPRCHRVCLRVVGE